MPIIEPVIRPPAEANSFLLQITTGCSANTCTFCGAYKGKPFKVKPLDEILGDIQSYANYNPKVRKVFLMDGDALVLNNSKLIPILEALNQAFPRLTRIAAYANGDQICSRTNEELKTLVSLKLKLFYIGLETGSQEILNDVHKKPTVAEMVQGVIAAQKAEIKSSVIVLLGIGGKEKSKLHIQETIKALNVMQPKLLSFLSLMLVPGTPLYEEYRKGRFNPIDSKDLLIESYEILKGLDCKQTIFRCNHASNYLPLEGRLPADKDRLLRDLSEGISGKQGLKPELFRGL